LQGICQEELAAIERCQKGSAKAFEMIVNRYTKQSYSIALGLVGNHDDALDLSQEAFVRAYNNIGKLRKSSRFFPWFYQILKNLCFTHLKRKRIRQTSSLYNPDGNMIPISAEGDWFVPDAVMERDETKDKVWKAISKLSDKHREVIVLRHFENFTYEQISAALHCSKGSVMSRLYHARKKLKKHLDTPDGGDLS
jgi:RNA polymerase sigma-70 factor (ECF subfamily)